VISLLLATGLAELGSRLAGPMPYWAPPRPLPDDAWRSLVHRRSQVPGLAYELAPDVDVVWRGLPIHINPFGLRDRDVDRDKPAGRVRLVALGDSLTFGFGVPAEATWPKALERLPTAEPVGASVPEARYEVLNFGVGGYSSREEATVLRRKVPEWRPDLALVGYFLNDPETDPIQPLSSQFQQPAWWQHSHLLRRLRKAWHDREVRRLGGGDYYRYLHADPRKWSSVTAAFADMAAAGREQGFRVVIVLFPAIPWNGWDDYRYRDLHRQVAAAAAEAGLQVVDLLDAFSRQPGRALRISNRDNHPNAAGHELAARALLPAVLEQLSPKAPSSP